MLHKRKKVEPSSIFAYAIMVFVVLMVLWAGYGLVKGDSYNNDGVALYINSNIVVGNSQGQANLFIRNNKSNAEPWQVTIVDKDTGECVYESDMIAPGEKVDYAKLQVDLTPGVHSCTAEFHIFTPDGEEKSTIRVGIQITVLT